jgi:hypothetical protein
VGADVGDLGLGLAAGVGLGGDDDLGAVVAFYRGADNLLAGVVGVGGVEVVATAVEVGTNRVNSLLKRHFSIINAAEAPSAEAKLGNG